MTARSDAALVRFAATLEHDPDFVAYALAQYREQMRLSTATLLAMLDCTELQYARLAICFRPDGASALFPSDVQRIAERTGVKASALASILRAVEISERQQARGGGSIGNVLAARDKLAERPAPYSVDAAAADTLTAANPPPTSPHDMAQGPVSGPSSAPQSAP